MNSILVFGAGQVAEVFAGYLRRNNREVAAHVVDVAHWQPNTWVSDRPVVAFEQVGKVTFIPASEHYFTVGMSFRGLNVPRAQKYQAMLDRGFMPLTFIHTMCGHGGATIGRGSFVMDANVIQDGAKVGENCVIWSHNHIGHHSKIGNHVWLSSGIVVSGACEIGDYTFIGSGATIADGVKIGARNIIGAGSLVLRDVPDGSVVAAEGTPISKVSSDRAARLLG